MAHKQKANSKKGSAVPLAPLHDRVVVRPLTPEEAGLTTASGIIIPDTAKEKPEQGVVVAVGPGKFDDGMLIPMSVEIGDRVVFSKYGYETVKLSGVEYYLIAESSISAKITG